VIAAVKRVVISDNKIFGQKSRDNDGRPPYVHDVDGDMTGWNALCDALPGSGVEELVAVDIGMGPKGVASLARATSASAAMTPQAIEASGATPGTRVLVPDRGEGGYVSFTRKRIGKNRHLIRFDTGLEEEITWTPQCTVMDAIAAVKRIVLSENKLFGAIDHPGYRDHGRHTVDADQSGWSALCDSFKGSSLEELVLVDVGMGVKGVTALADAIRAMAALNSLTMDSTGVPKLPHSGYSGYKQSGPRTYTLAMGEETINLSSKNLGVADVTLLTAWLHRPEVIATVNALLLSGNGLAGAIIWSDGSVRSGVDIKMDGIISLFVSLRTSQITMLDLSRCGLGPASMGHLADYLRDEQSS
jgi:hypothetical protein